VCDERIVIVAMELFYKVKQRHGRFEENLNASADAIYSNDFSIAKGRIGTEHSQPFASLVAVLYEHDSHGESVFRLCNHGTMV
jgi:hypothetical protein